MSMCVCVSMCVCEYVCVCVLREGRGSTESCLTFFNPSLISLKALYMELCLYVSMDWM